MSTYRESPTKVKRTPPSSLAPLPTRAPSSALAASALAGELSPTALSPSTVKVHHDHPLWLLQLHLPGPLKLCLQPYT